MEHDILKAIAELQKNMESRFEKVDHRFDGIDERLQKHDEQFIGIRTQLKEHDEQFTGIRTQLKEHDEQFTGILTELKDKFTGVHTQLDRMENERQAEIMSMLKHISQKQDVNNQNNDYLLHKNQEHDKEIYRLKKHFQS
ncbi:hypothetical protein [Jeotgalibacillus campisalis]|uniref:t-SNARE coiled-coil homology domain-containing protein n=1 Tax=Jeotgalibacillus campisalis TaxID=220754 RepID=A0A0C2WAP7_9BACL|nr:hypothetical protein [Jeotgalibacillus campisalis]KIL53113.1 hypothetical protein KR50_04420 [Jeotgalibacillus campisalis]